MEKLINSTIDRIVDGANFWSTLPWLLLLFTILGVRFVLKRKKLSFRFNIKIAYKRD